MNVLFETWHGLSTARRLLWAALAAGLLAGLVWLASQMFNPHYEPAFTQLRTADAAAITAELDKLKLPYQLGDEGSTILMPRAQVHTARMKVLGKELPLAGHVGFELFNNADLGLTEFAQRVNYQRALQGELARSIMGLEGVQSARVHLSMPEQGYLRRAGAKAKASVMLSTHSGQPLDATAQRNIQRLVAAAVPELEAGQVAVVHQAAGSSGDTTILHADPHLEAKLELEGHYTRRILALADRWFGPGRTQVSVDLQLNFDQARVVNETTNAASRNERVEPPRRSASAPPEAVEAPAPTADPSGRRSSQRRVEEIQVAPGAVRQAHVGILLEGEVDKAELERFRALVHSAAGLRPERGDSVVLFSVGQPRPAALASASQPGNAVARPAAQTPRPEPGASTVPALPLSPPSQAWILALGMAVLAGLAVLAWWWQGPRSARPLAGADRDELARRLDELLRNREAA